MIALLLMAGGGELMAQERRPSPRPERRMPVDMEEQSARLVEALGLTGAAAEQFVPTFKRYKSEMVELMREHRPNPPKHTQRGAQQAVKPTDEEIEAHILARFAMSRAIVDVREKYYHEFRRFMSPQQIEMLYEIEQHNAHRMRDAHRARKGE